VSRDDRTYARFYYEDFIRDYPDVWSDDLRFACWLRLFVRAEQMWPLPVELPRSVRPKVLAYLVERGLVSVSGDFYTVKGMDAERTRRRNAARNAAAQRWDSGRNANASADAMPRRDETSKDETSIPPPPTSGGRRRDETNARATGSSPRQLGQAPRDLGESPRQVTRREKRDPTPLHVILNRANANGGDQ
jgi:hypothetical protein